MPLFLLQEQTRYFKEDDPFAVTLLLAGAGGVLLTGLVIKALTGGFGKKGSRGEGTGLGRFSTFALYRTARAYGLTWAQAKILEYVFKNDGVTDPGRVAADPAALDKHFKRAYKMIREQNTLPEEEIQRKLSMLFSVRNTIDLRHNTSPPASSTRQIAANMAAVLTVNRETYPVKVISAKGDSVLVDRPRDAGGTPLNFSQGTRVNLAFFTKTNKGFSYDSQILGPEDTSFGPALRLSHTPQAKTMTHRRFKRTPAAFSCTCRLIRVEEAGNKKKKKRPPKMIVESKRMPGAVTDISIGGCAIKTQASIPAGSRLKIDFDCSPNAPPVAVLGQILRINRGGAAGAVMHVKFIKVPRKAMNTINSLVFEYAND
ncbi:MAG: PilZ domain-containing protein [Treponema sp.]|jgi:hypothetical protein|nr:PilZ domain-containing protein [Treponema sp.]